MAYGDVGGPVTELVIACQTMASGDVNIRKGDAVALVGPYTVSNAEGAETPVFGEALADVAENRVGIPVRVRGICVFAYDDAAPAVDGLHGIVMAETAGKVKIPASGSGSGMVVKAGLGAAHVLL